MSLPASSRNDAPFKPSRLFRNAKEKAALVAVAFGGADTVLTTLTYYFSGSSALLADTLKTILEFCAATVSYFVLRSVRDNATERFDYGTGKMESLSSLFIGVLMTVCLLGIVANGVYRIINPLEIGGAGVWAGIALQAVYGCINGWIFRENLRLSRLENSTLLKSQANLFLSKMLANIFIVLALGAGIAFSDYEWAVYIDPAASLVVGLFILVCATGVFHASVFDLMDRTLEESDQLVILRALSKHFDDFHELHGIRSRRAGGRAFIEIHLEFDPLLPMARASLAAASIREAIEASIPQSQVSICLADRPF